MAKTKKKPAARKPKAKAKTKNRANAKPAAKSTGIALREAHVRWLESVAQSIRVNGGPSLSSAEVLGALIDATSSREIDPRRVRDLESLRVAFGALDTTELEAQLREKRPSVEPSVLDALKDSIK